MGTGITRSVRALLAGTLVLGGALTAVVIGGAVPASAATVVQTIAVGSEPTFVSSDGTHVWVANLGGNTVSELDASTGSVIQTIAVGSLPQGVSSDGTHVWVANGGSNTVSELDASTGSVIQTITVGSYPVGVSSDGTHVWVTNSNGNTVSELDASTGSVIQTLTVGSGPPVASDPLGVSSDGTHVWVTNSGDNTVSEIDSGGASGFRITTSSLPSAAPGVAYGPVTLQEAGAGTSVSPYVTTLKWKKVNLPKGLRLSKDGMLSGTPNKNLAAGSSSVTLQVTETVTTLNGKKKVKTKTTVQATIPLTIT
jgi:YVTN family beta-propeller protein